VKKEVSTSPMPKPTTEKHTSTFDFLSAIEQLLIGQKVHKLDWEDKGYYGILHSGILHLHKPDGKLYPWLISEGDLVGKDYIII